MLVAKLKSVNISDSQTQWEFCNSW